MEAREKQVWIYEAESGRLPYREWLLALKDRRAREVIVSRIARVRSGNLGSVRSVGDSVFELKVNHGPGYRVYFGQDGNEWVILLCGGDKSTQDADIKKAKTYWADYKAQNARRSR
jgi:putative addiction module killer protein